MLSTQGMARRIRDAADMTSVELTERSGVSRMTQHRIDAGLSDSTIGTLRELALAAGFDLELNLVPVSDPDAAVAARSILDSAVTSEDLTRGASEWVTRLRRLTGPVNDPVDIVSEAGRATAPLQRKGAILLLGDWDDLKLASAASASAAPWVVSGTPALRRIAETSAQPSGPAIVYTADPEAVARHLAHFRPARPSTANLALLPLAPIVLVDSWEDGPVHLVAPVQAILDNIGLGGQNADIALATAREW